MLNGRWPHGLSTSNWVRDTNRRFQPGEGPSRGLLRDCTTSPINRFTALTQTHTWAYTLFRPDLKWTNGHTFCCYIAAIILYSQIYTTRNLSYDRIRPTFVRDERDGVPVHGVSHLPPERLDLALVLLLVHLAAQHKLHVPQRQQRGGGGSVYDWRWTRDQHSN